MSIKNHTDLNSDLDSAITNNGNGSITGPILNQQLEDLADSAVNKSGDSGILGKLTYDSELSITDNKDITHKGYTDNTSFINAIIFG